MGLSRAISKIVPGVGGLSHGAWRAFETERKVTDARNFIDGDHVETFLDLTQADADKVVAIMAQDGWTRAALGPLNEGAGEGEGEGAGEGEGTGEGEGEGGKGSNEGALKELTAEEVARRVEEMARLS